MHTFLRFNKYLQPVGPVQSCLSNKYLCEISTEKTQGAEFTSSRTHSLFVNLDEKTDHRLVLQIAREVYLEPLHFIS